MGTTKQVVMAVYRESWHSHNATEYLPPALREHEPLQAIYLLEGDITANDIARKSGDGFFLPPDATCSMQPGTTVNLLRFLLLHSSFPPKTQKENLFDEQPLNLQSQSLVLWQDFSFPQSNAVLRLDQVSFPPAATAYKHTHPGGGIRYLTTGSLKVCGTDSEHLLKPDSAWFEDANTPVEAFSDSHTHSCFIRMLLLPETYYEKSTFTLVNPDDAQKPRKQSNQRFFDQRIDLSR